MVSIEERLYNVSIDESTVNGTVTIDFPWTTGQIIITNDSTTADLTVRLRDTTGQELTLRPTETLTVYHGTRAITLTGTNVPYRVWGFG